MTVQRERANVGVIGAGFIAQVAHLPSLVRLDGCRLAALADNRSKLLVAVADRYGIPAHFVDYGALVAMSDLDAVVVAIPRRAQSAVVRDALKAGRPVLTEKPIAYTAKVANELKELAASNSILLAVGYTRLHDPGVKLFRRLLAEATDGGAMGDLLHVRMADFCGAYTVPMPSHLRSTEKRPSRYVEDPLMPEFLDRDFQAAYDYTVNVASHDINLLRNLFGDDLTSVSFRVWPGRAQHAVFALPQADVELSVGPARLGVWEQRLDAYFRDGCLSLVLDSSLAQQSCGTVIRRTPTKQEVLTPPLSERAFAFDLQAAAFLDSLRSGADFAATGSDAAKDLEVIEALWHIASIGS